MLPEDPATAVEELAAEAEPVPWPDAEAGLFRAEPREPVAACAMDWAAAPDMDWLEAAACAPDDCTPVVAAREPDTEGAKEALVPEDALAMAPSAAAEELAEADWAVEDPLGAERAALRAALLCEAAWALAEAIP